MHCYSSFNEFSRLSPIMKVLLLVITFSGRLFYTKPVLTLTSNLKLKYIFIKGDNNNNDDDDNNNNNNNIYNNDNNNNNNQ